MKHNRATSTLLPSNYSSFTAWLLIGIVAGLWALLVSWMAIARYESFNHVGNDLGIYVQVLWTTANGKPFYNTLKEQSHFLGVHFEPWLALLVPIYRYWPDPRLLLIVQSFALAGGAFPLFAFAKSRLTQAMALVVVLTYLLSPLLALIARLDFHEIALAVPLLMAAGAALLDRRPRATGFWLAMALLIKEEVAIIMIGFALYALIIQRRTTFGSISMLSALLYAWLIMGWLMPSLNPQNKQYLFVERYASLGSTPKEIILTLLTQPLTVMGLLNSAANRQFISYLLFPLAGLPLLGFPVTLLAFPTLAYLMLSDYKLQVQGTNYYTAPLMPFLFLSTVVALQRLQSWHARIGWAATGLLLLTTLLSAYSFSPLPGGGKYEPKSYEVSSGHKVTQALLTAIPPDKAVVSDWRYYPWLANRWMLDNLLKPIFPAVKPDLLVMRELAPDASIPPIYPWIVPNLSEHQQVMVTRYSLRDKSSDGTMIWERRPPEEEVSLERLDIPFERGMVLVGVGTPPEVPLFAAEQASRTEVIVTKGSTLPIWLAWGATKRLDERISFTIQLWRGNERVAQIDQEMGSGHFPTNLWHTYIKKPVVVGEFPLVLPSELEAGHYRLMAGAYESETVTPLLQPDGNAWVELGVVVVE